MMKMIASLNRLKYRVILFCTHELTYARMHFQGTKKTLRRFRHVTLKSFLTESAGIQTQVKKKISIAGSLK